MQPVKPFRPHRLFFWLNGIALLLLLLLIFVLFSVSFGEWIALPYGRLLAIILCVVNALLLVYACVLVVWQVLRRCFFQALVPTWWQLALGYLLAAVFWGWLWLWTADKMPRKWWGQTEAYRCTETV